MNAVYTVDNGSNFIFFIFHPGHNVTTVKYIVYKLKMEH